MPYCAFIIRRLLISHQDDRTLCLTKEREAREQDSLDHDGSVVLERQTRLWCG
jgi:hypothetical protein